MSRAIRLWSAVPLALGMLVGAVSGMAPAREATPVWEPGLQLMPCIVQPTLPLPSIR